MAKKLSSREKGILYPFLFFLFISFPQWFVSVWGLCFGQPFFQWLQEKGVPMTLRSLEIVVWSIGLIVLAIIFWSDYKNSKNPPVKVSWTPWGFVAGFMLLFLANNLIGNASSPTSVQADASSLRKNSIKFEQAIYLINDQEDSSIMAAKKATASFTLLSLGDFTKQMLPLMAGGTTSENSEKLSAAIAVSGNYYGFLLAIQRLQISNIKETHNFYRGKLLKFDKSDYDAFISNAREKPKVLNDLSILYNKIASTNFSSNWNSNATIIVDEFMNSR